jgi:inorganic triphosphatase YgiF
MPIEIELKLAIHPKDITALRQHELLHRYSTKNTTEHLVSTYYDTPDSQLKAAGYVIRIRQIGNILKQTIKSSNRSENGLHQREEWEKELTENKLDFSDFPDKKIRDLFTNPKLYKTIVPLFKTDFERENWFLTLSEQSKIMMSLDQGLIIAGQLTDVICEIELELMQGEAQDLHDVAIQLQQHLTLHPENSGKAGRGYRLLKRWLKETKK